MSFLQWKWYYLASDYVFTSHLLRKNDEIIRLVKNFVFYSKINFQNVQLQFN